MKDQKHKNIKPKWLGVGALIVAVVAVVSSEPLSSQWGKAPGDSRANDEQQISADTSSDGEQLLPADPRTWQLKITSDEINSPFALAHNNIIYAVKNEYTSTVYQKNIQTGGQTEILKFNEQHKADASCNLWEGLPPAIALSPSKQSLAFIDEDGLKVYDLQSRTTRTYIYKTAKEECDECVPKWSVKFNYVGPPGPYSLALPLWAFDGKFISFFRSLYEGAALGLIDTESGNYIIPKGAEFGLSYLDWSPVSRSYVKSSSSGYGEYFGGLYVSDKNDISEGTDLATKFDIAGDTPFLEANFSPDGAEIIFVFAELDRIIDIPGFYQDDDKYLAMANTDGTGFKILVENVDVQMPFFSVDGNAVLYIKKRNGTHSLVRYDLTTKESYDLISFPPEFESLDKAYWTADGFLVLVTSLSNSSQTGGSCAHSKRMFVLDTANKQVVYASRIFDGFTNFAGFLN
ncbi:MAG: hypothetical protein A3C03_01545 [Candidatus Colwellbacteria bacterium RIFCSPHIGHO2_02_FULL_45_17]|uniref:Uncharacterized protein n=1 Tax=uncultured Parcubacteria bacterium Rifle_16ft_4_minimus_37647 TaxID=1665140 RepID=A0A0H4T468_9BACT|nr:hypothetical protein [uncultured Parcubacteria bacterium Rifle_16ft_4_minimus_37647]OGY57850.1 MAG: hypothetical protein A3C03_01545 [Candidatus Colwellbacteria bacterium RIFCSPHIGHO2_02_FULL_45_17]